MDCIRFVIYTIEGLYIIIYTVYVMFITSYTGIITNIQLHTLITLTNGTLNVKGLSYLRCVVVQQATPNCDVKWYDGGFLQLCTACAIIKDVPGNIGIIDIKLAWLAPHQIFMLILFIYSVRKLACALKIKYVYIYSVVNAFEVIRCN